MSNVGAPKCEMLLMVIVNNDVLGGKHLTCGD